MNRAWRVKKESLLLLVARLKQYDEAAVRRQTGPQGGNSGGEEEGQREMTLFELLNWAMCEFGCNSALCPISDLLHSTGFLSNSSQFEFEFLSVKPGVLTKAKMISCQHYFAGLYEIVSYC